MPLRLPLRRYIQDSQKTEPSRTRWGSVQWVLARPLYRFARFDLGQVPVKNRSQALQLELAQWTPFAQSAYYIGWHDAHALVWAWDHDATQAAMQAQGLKPARVPVIPETLLQQPQAQGLCLRRCHEGFEGQLWQDSQLTHSRWWPQPPSAEQWLMFQRDAGTPPEQQQNQCDAPLPGQLGPQAWVRAASADNSTASLLPSLAMALAALLLLAPTLWYGLSLYQLQDSMTQLMAQKAQLQNDVKPIAQARSEALDQQARINALRALDLYPGQISLMAKLSQALPPDKSSLKEWDFSAGQLKATLTSPAGIASTNLITLLQQAGPFLEVKALPVRDPLSVTFQMQVQGH